MARERDDRENRESGQTRDDREQQPPITNERTTVRAEEERRAEDERVQRQRPDEFAGRGHDPWREPPVDADDDSERFRARENEDQSEG